MLYPEDTARRGARSCRCMRIIGGQALFWSGTKRRSPFQAKLYPDKQKNLIMHRSFLVFVVLAVMPLAGYAQQEGVSLLVKASPYPSVGVPEGCTRAFVVKPP